MEITEVRVDLVEGHQELRAFCDVVFDDGFILRSLKVIDGIRGPFVAMPSRKLMLRCPECRCKNKIRAQHCNGCGTKLNPDDPKKLEMNLYEEIAHPTTREFRGKIQRVILEAYQQELERSKQLGT